MPPQNYFEQFVGRLRAMVEANPVVVGLGAFLLYSMLVAGKRRS